ARARAAPDQLRVQAEAAKLLAQVLGVAALAGDLGRHVAASHGIYRRDRDVVAQVLDAAHQPASGGRPADPGRCSSSRAATRTSTSSRPKPATSCTPIGSPEALQASGSETAGWPVTLNGIRNGVSAPDRMKPLSGCAGSGTSSPSGGGGSGMVGVTSRSK